MAQTCLQKGDKVKTDKNLSDILSSGKETNSKIVQSKCLFSACTNSEKPDDLYSWEEKL